MLAGIADDERNYNRKAYYEYVKQLVSKQTMTSERLKVPTFKENIWLTRKWVFTQ